MILPTGQLYSHQNKSIISGGMQKIKLLAASRRVALTSFWGRLPLPGRGGVQTCPTPSLQAFGGFTLWAKWQASSMIRYTVHICQTSTTFLNTYLYDHACLQVYRQDYVGWSGFGDVSHYTLAGEPGWSGAYVQDENGNVIAPSPLTANPDFYTAVLWKKLMGPRVLDVRYTDVQSHPMVSGISLHAHCSSSATIAGSVVFAYANTLNVSVDFGSYIHVANQSGTKENGHLKTSPRTEYFLTTGSAEGDLQSRLVSLNGASPLTFESSLDGKYVESGSLVVPPYSYGYFEILEANANACM